MTTAAFKDGVLATDSLSTGGYIDQKGFQKIFHIEDMVGNKLHVAFAGRISTGLKFIHALESGDEVDLDDDFEAIVVSGKHVAFFDKNGVPIPGGQPAAIGSGACFAMGAMLAGASAEEAVKIAIKLDEGSGGKVQTAVTHETKRRQRINKTDKA